MKRTFSLLLAVFLVIGNVLSANAAEDQWDENNIAKLEDTLLQEGVSKEQTKNLIEKLKNGEEWDCIKEEYADLEPQIARRDYSKTIYPDGSYKIIEINEMPTSRTVWLTQEYLVSAKWGLANLSFKVDYERDDVEKLAKIRSQYAFDVTTFGGTYEEDTKGYLEGWRDKTSAWYAVKFNAFQGIGAKRYYVKVFVDFKGPSIDYTGK